MDRRWADPTFRAARSDFARERITRLNQDPEFRARLEVANRRKWQDPEYRINQIGKLTEGARLLWQDSNFREKITEALRVARLRPDFYINNRPPTIHGVRRDTGFAQSAWEANMHRVLTYVGREFLTRETFELNVPPEIQTEYKMPSVVNKSVDFISQDRRGSFVGYEIMAHPTEDPLGWIRFGLLQEQYPSIKFKPITEDRYFRIRDRFKDKIDQDPRFCGWEGHGDNLYTDPEKFAVLDPVIELPEDQ